MYIYFLLSQLTQRKTWLYVLLCFTQETCLSYNKAAKEIFGKHTTRCSFWEICSRQLVSKLTDLQWKLYPVTLFILIGLLLSIGQLEPFIWLASTFLFLFSQAKHKPAVQVGNAIPHSIHSKWILYLEPSDLSLDRYFGAVILVEALQKTHQLDGSSRGS